MPLDTLVRSMSSVRQHSQSLLVRAREGGIGSVMAGTSMLGALNQSRLLSQGQRVDPQKHYNGWTYACIGITAERVAGQEIMVARKIRKGSQTKAVRIDKATVPKTLHDRIDNLELLESHPLIDALRRPNQLQLQRDLVFVMVAGLELTAESFLWVRDDDKDGRKDIYPLPAHWMTPVHGKDKIHVAWDINPDNSTETFRVPAEQIVYSSYPNPNSPIRPISPLQAVARPVLIDEQIQECQRRSFRSPHPAMAVHVAAMPDQIGLKGSRPELSPDQRARIEGMILQMYSGAMNYDKPIILDGSIDHLEMLSKTVKEMDYNNSAKGIKERLTQGYKVNPISMGQVESANRASAMMADQNLLSININPKINMISGILTYKLAPLYAAPDEELVVWVVPAITIDRELDLQECVALRNSGGLTTNEFRHKLGYQPLDGPVGNMVLVPNTFTLQDPAEEPVSPADVAAEAAQSVAAQGTNQNDEQADGRDESSADTNGQG